MNVARTILREAGVSYIVRPEDGHIVSMNMQVIVNPISLMGSALVTVSTFNAIHEYTRQCGKFVAKFNMQCVLYLFHMRLWIVLKTQRI